jgi:two-component system chemotaxis sensor kinase CheA
MNEFLRQFLVESREYVEQATAGLLVLEHSPGDTERLDEVFRAFHTLKGGAAIVEFSAMERVVHAAETVLVEARSGTRPLHGAAVGDCLACLDQVSIWLDTIDEADGLPAGSEGLADALVERFAARRGPGGAAPAVTPEPAIDWIADAVARHAALAHRAITAVRLIPDRDAFYRGEDPVALVSQLPHLLALDLQPASEWPALGALDPFACNLVLTGLTGAAAADVAAHLQGHSGVCEVRTIASDETSLNTLAFSGRAREVLEAQVALLGHDRPAHFAGRLSSAGLTAQNVMRSCGRTADAQAIAHATQASLDEKTPLALLGVLTRLLVDAPAEPGPSIEPPQRLQSLGRTLRIDADRIDALVRLTGELTVATNALGYLAQLARADGSALAGGLRDRHGEFERLVDELQRSVLEMRVLPLRLVLQRFPRMLREISASLGKSIRLSIEGDDTEADKTIVEMLFEPLLHVIRNAADHGIEAVTERARLGKPPVATIRIRAVREGNEVLIEVTDDGRGIDLQRVREIARMSGASEESLRAMNDAELVELLFAPGFSTVTDATELSGRGVGMDVVRTAVARIGGRVSIDSRAGAGTTVRIALPYSVMMTQVVTVESAGQMFGIPLDAVVETIRVPRSSVVAIGAARAVALGDRTLPVIELATALGTPERAETDADALIVVAAVGGHACGIRVDRLGERLQVMLKPLDGLLSETPGISGTTMLGDGRVLLVLDVAELLR